MACSILGTSEYTQIEDKMRKKLKPFQFIKTIVIFAEDEDDAWSSLEEQENDIDSEWVLDENFDGKEYPLE